MGKHLGNKGRMDGHLTAVDASQTDQWVGAEGDTLSEQPARLRLMADDMVLGA